MKANLARYRTSAIRLTLLFGAWIGVTACSTTSVAPEVPKEHVPVYTDLPQPLGFAMSDVLAIFKDPSAPQAETLSSCDSEFQKLAAQDVREQVKSDPIRFHWCFYSKILELDQGLSSDTYVDEKQKRVLSTFEFVVPVARAFMTEFHDTRYLSWAVRDYRRLSDALFFRKLEISPQLTADLVEAAKAAAPADAAGSPSAVVRAPASAPAPQPAPIDTIP